MKLKKDMYILFISLVLSLPCAARVYRIQLDFKDAFGRSDVVVIGRAVGTNVAQRDARLEDYPAIAVETAFQVDTVLKGDTNTTEVTMFHYRLDSSRIDVFFNGPATVSFPTNGPTSYLLFLRRDTSNRLIPAYGQGDAAGSAFRLTSEFDAGWLTGDKRSAESGPGRLPDTAVLQQMAQLSNSVERLTRRLTEIETEWERIKPNLDPILKLMDEMRYKPVVEEDLIGAQDDQ